MTINADEHAQQGRETVNVRTRKISKKTEGLLV